MTLQDNSETPRPRREGPANPDQLMIRLRERYPAETKEDLIERWIDHVIENDLWNRSVLHQQGVMRWGRLIEPPKPQPRESATERAAKVEQVKEQIKARAVKSIFSWKFNDKELGDHIGDEGRKLTGGLGRLFANVRPNQRLRDAMSEKEALRLWREPKK